jgi:hypothetical protein
MLPANAAALATRWAGEGGQLRGVQMSFLSLESARSSSRRPYLALLATALGISISAAYAKQVLANVPLLWRPTSQVAPHSGVVDSPPAGVSSSEPAKTENGGGASSVPAPSVARRIQILPFTDTRKNPSLIAENREDADKGTILPVTTRDDVAAWCSDRLRDILKQLGFEIVDADADLQLAGEVRRFFVVETTTYQGEVGLKIELKAKDGTTLWSGVANGAASRFGRSYSLENYHEVISDSLLDAVQRLAEHPAFVHAVGGPASSGSAR